MKKLILRNRQSPGDVLACTAAVENLHRKYPGEYQTDVRTTAWEIWQHNPLITEISGDDPAAEVIDLQYPAIHHSNSRPTTMIEATTAYLADRLQRPIPCVVNHPMLYLSDEEKGWVDQVAQEFTGGRKVKFWLINAGSKSDFTAKQWPTEFFQEVVNATRGRVLWVQIGASEHKHPRLNHVFDLVGKTDTRQLIRLAWHAAGGLGPISFSMHLCAAFRRPYVCLAGGREPVQWNAYPLQHYLHTIGSMSCCQVAACWRSKVLPTEGEQTCERPVYGMDRPIAECMTRIRPQEVITIVERLACAF